MNATERNEILIAALEAEDRTDDTYILPDNHPEHTFRVAFDESDWVKGIKTRKAFIEWDHCNDYTTVKCKPTLSTRITWRINNCDCRDTFREECDRVFDEVSLVIRKDYEK